MNKLLSFFTFFVLLITPTIALAMDPTASGNRFDKRIDKINTRMAMVENRLEDRKESIASREARMVAKMEQLKAKLLKFRDKNKAQRAQRVSDNLNAINKRRTDQMSKHLDKMSVILDKLKLRTGASSASAEIASASAEIQKAKDGVETQAGKDYTIVVNTEATVKNDATKQRQALFADLKATHNLVVLAKQSLAAAISSLSSMKGSENGQ